MSQRALGRQFNPNQAALPGMEHHPNEKALAQGYRFEVKRKRPGYDSTHQITVHHGENKASELFVQADKDRFHAKGEVRAVKTWTEHQRKGLARATWDVANKLGMKPEHSTIRSDEGDAWARAVGGKLPKRRVFE